MGVDLLETRLQICMYHKYKPVKASRKSIKSTVTLLRSFKCRESDEKSSLSSFNLATVLRLK